MDPQALGSPEQLLGATSALSGVLTAVISAAAILMGAALLIWGRKLLRGVLALTGLFTGVIIGMVVLPLIAGGSVGGLSTVIVGGVLGAFCGTAAGLLMHRIGTALVSGLTSASIALTLWSLIAFPSLEEIKQAETQFAENGTTQTLDQTLMNDMSNVPFATVASAEGGFGYFPDTQINAAKDVLAEARASGAPLPEAAIPDVLKSTPQQAVVEAKPAKPQTPAAKLPPAAMQRPVVTETTTHKGLAAKRTKEANGKTRITIGKATAQDESAKQRLQPLGEELPQDASTALAQLKELPLLDSPAANEVMKFASGSEFKAMGPLTGFGDSSGSPDYTQMMPQIPLGKIVAGLIIAALAGVAGFAGALLRHKQAACIVTSVIGASWLVVGFSGTASVIPEIASITSDLPNVVWMVLLVILAVVGTAMQLKSLKPAAAAPLKNQSLAKSMRSLADPSAMEEGGKTLE